MKNQKLDSFVIIPRKIKNDYYEGKISRPERNLLTWLRVIGNPYGIAEVSLEGLANDTYNNSADKNYINKTLLSLKRKRYIWYQDRAGRRGSFEVHLDDWPMKNGEIKILDCYFEQAVGRGESKDKTTAMAEAKPENVSCNQNLGREKSIANKQNCDKLSSQSTRGCDNDTEIDKDNETKSPCLDESDLSLAKFRVDSYEKKICKEIALATGDRDVAFCYGTYKKHGLDVLIDAFEEFKNSDGRMIDDPPSFFNYLVQERLDKIL